MVCSRGFLCLSLACQHTTPYRRLSPGKLAQKDGHVQVDRLACRLTASEAHASGLVSRVVSADKLMPEARSMAARIAGLSALAVAKAKDCINRAHEVPLSEGLRYEQYVCP